MITHILLLLPLLASFLIEIFVWNVGLTALAVTGYCMAMAYYMFINTWEWVFFPFVAIMFLISLYIFIRKAVEGELT